MGLHETTASCMATSLGSSSTTMASSITTSSAIHSLSLMKKKEEEGELPKNTSHVGMDMTEPMHRAAPQRCCMNTTGDRNARICAAPLGHADHNDCMI